MQACYLPAGVLYASKETHYSVFKAGKMYRMQTEAVNTLTTGEIDYEHFRQRLRANNDKPAIINVNIGTTVKGAVDDLDRVLEVLTEEGFDEDRFYIHCDGALFGLMVCMLLCIHRRAAYLQRNASMHMTQHVLLCVCTYVNFGQCKARFLLHSGLHAAMAGAAELYDIPHPDLSFVSLLHSQS